MRDAKEYQRNLLKLKAGKAGNANESLMGDDAITCLKLDMINGLEQEIDHLTQIWEDELNTIAELIRFQIPLQRTNANLHRLRQQIVAREMLFKKRIKMVSELRTQKRLKYVVKEDEEENDCDDGSHDEEKDAPSSNSTT